MILLSLDKISKSFPGKVLLDKVSLYINDSDKIGIIGINGAYYHVDLSRAMSLGLGNTFLLSDSLMWGSIRVSQMLSLILVILAAVKLIADARKSRMA